MTSGQWTIGAMTKAKVCLPVQSVSISPTMTARASMSNVKKFLIIASVFLLQTIFTSGWRRTRSCISAQWSGSMWLTIR